MAFRVPSNFGIRGLPDIMDQAAPDPRRSLTERHGEHGFSKPRRAYYRLDGHKSRGRVIIILQHQHGVWLEPGVITHYNKYYAKLTALQP